MAELSRACIRDTLMLKRDHLLQQSQLGYALYTANIRTLRSSQLAPYRSPWNTNRIGNMQKIKRAAPDIVIILRGGLVQEVRASNPYTRVYLADYDIDHDDPTEEAALCEAEERGCEADMHVVY